MIRKPYVYENISREVEVKVYLNGKLIKDEDWDEVLFSDRGKNWIETINFGRYKDKRVRLITDEMWHRSPLSKRMKE